jgi:glucose-6-phosphate 1-dehydrogenase
MYKRGGKMNEKVDSQLIVIFGASGDLTGRKLIHS